MTTRFVSSCLHANEGVPLTRQKVITESESGSSSFEYSLINVDDLISFNIQSCHPETPRSTRVGAVSRVTATSLDDAVEQQMKEISLPEALSKVSRVVYSDSRALEFTCSIELKSFYLEKASSTNHEIPDADGFVTVSSGFKPSIALETQLTDPGLTDFYKFQVKERKLKEWQVQKTRKLSAEKDVLLMAKRRKFDL